MSIILTCMYFISFLKAAILIDTIVPILENAMLLYNRESNSFSLKLMVRKRNRKSFLRYIITDTDCIMIY